MDPVTDRQKSVAEVLSANRQFARSTARTLEKLLTPELEEGRPLPDLVYLQDLLAAALERHWRHLSTADEACEDAKGHRRALIDGRDDDAALLYREVVDLRTVLRGRFGARPSQRFLGLRGDTSRDPVVLLRQADRAVARLGDGNRPLPSSKLRPSATARARWTAPVAAAAGALRAIVARIADAVKRLDATRLARKRVLAAFNDAFVGIAGTFEALYRLTGRDDRAEVVRPSKQYPGLTYRQGQGKVRRKARREPEARVVRFPRLGPVLRLFGSRAKSS